MERLDQHILALLARDGRMSYTDIGRETGLSTSAAQQRVRRLEQRGVIKGYHADIDATELGRTLTAFISIRSTHTIEDDATPGLLASMPQIRSCFSVAGTASYLCMAEVGSTADLDALLTHMRVNNLVTETTVVLTTEFRDRPLIDPPTG